MDKYVKIVAMSQEQAEKDLSSDNPEVIGNALLSSSLNNKNWEWVENKCIEFLEYPDLLVQKSALIALGHLARVHGTLHLEVILPLLKKITNKELKGIVQDTFDDIETFIKNKA